MKRIWLFCTLGLLLLAAAAIQMRARKPPLQHSSMAGGTALADALPAVLGGGTARDEPIAESEEMRRAVDELLNFDDAVYRVYRLGDLEVAVYAAWWRPGKMSPRLVAGHTPDVCWPANGWERDRAAENQWDTTLRAVAAAGLLDGECRVFRAEQRHVHVVFWHRVGSELVSYGTGYAPPWWAPLAEMWRDGLNLRREQLFVRVSANAPLAEVLARPELAPLADALREMGLSRP